MSSTISLSDKYVAREGRAYMSGTQALVRLALIQKERDAAAGHSTAGFISGYRGSPLGSVDQEIWRAGTLIESHDIKFLPGVNEDLAATTIWGTQQVNLFEGARYDGVFAMWYGKGPGVDRSADVLRHANAAGTSQLGGVLAVAGDDHACKSSTLPHQTEQIFEAVGIPVLAPSNVQDVLDFGLHGWAMSRFSGCWVALKCVSDVIESSSSVDVSIDRVNVTLPEGEPSRAIRYPDAPPAQEKRLLEEKLAAAQAYVLANGLDRVALTATEPRLGIVTSGKSYPDVRRALALLGIDDALAARSGIAIFKVAMVWPLEPRAMEAFGRGLGQLLVIEEKRSLLEAQIKELFFALPDGERPTVSGKTDGRTGKPLFPASGELSPALIARSLVSFVAPLLPDHDFSAILKRLDGVDALLSGGADRIVRPPHYCSGCPHNTSTRLPEGSRATAGIGCHGMATFIYPETKMFCQMGGEGLHWVGQQPFSSTGHVFANMGEGTYFHSGYLAIRAAVAAGTPITYKILFNDAVAMTGGQPVDGVITVPRITRQLAAEGVDRIIVVTDEPEKYAVVRDLAPGVPVRHRDDLDAIQRELRDYPGVSAIVYDQTCAAEKRRRRKRGTFPDPPRRVVINAEVCEGCGDCSAKSNCISITPTLTEHGVKRAIDQSSCNKDFSCVKGFCPSFVTVEGGTLRKGKGAAAAEPFFVPEPELAPSAGTHSILVTGIGGTGVVTIGALLGMAAHIEGKEISVLDMAGLAQKGGSVWSHVRIAASGSAIDSAKIATGDAATLIACDMVVAAGDETISRLDSARTRAIVNTAVSITGDEVRAFASGATSGLANGPANVTLARKRMQQKLASALPGDRVDFIDATKIATDLMGDAIATNLFLLGFAWQKGAIPLSRESISEAIRLNGTAITANLASFEWGRCAAHDLDRVREMIAEPASRIEARSLDELIEHRAGELAEYQNQAYADRYHATIARIANAPGTCEELVEAVARNLYKLMAYKDEYEVARLFANDAFRHQLEAQFEGDFSLRFHLAPPIFAKRDPLTGQARKREFGQWMMVGFRILARLRRLRGSWLDPFRNLEDRRMERLLIAEYEATIEWIAARLTPARLPVALEIASLPDAIRGYGHIKERHIRQVSSKKAELLGKFEQPANSEGGSPEGFQALMADANTR